MINLLFITLLSFLSPSTPGFEPVFNKIEAREIISVPKVGFNELKPKVLYGTSSYYADMFEGRRTANGEVYYHSRATAACNVLPLGTWIRVTNLKNNKSVVVKVNDRLHPRMTRVTDLSLSSAKKLGFTRAGLAKVKVEVLGRKKPV